MTDIIRDSRGGTCPPDIALASFVDGALTADARAVVVTHVAGCDDCREVVATAAAALLAHPPAVAPWFRRRGVVAGLAAGLAASLLLMLVPRDPATPDTWAGVAAAVGDARTVEARLSDQRDYLAPASPTRSAAPASGAAANFELEAIVGRLQEQADREPTTGSLHAFGVAALVFGRTDDAVRALSDAAAGGTGGARVLSDLAAAYATRAARSAGEASRTEDWARALDAAERARALDDSLAPAWFNRALALDGLGRRADARQAWQAYAARFTTSDGWRAEALRRMDPAIR